MIKLKTEVNKTKLFKELEDYANEAYENSWESEYAKIQFMNGAKHLFKLLRLPVVIVPKGTLCDTEPIAKAPKNMGYGAEGKMVYI